MFTYILIGMEKGDACAPPPRSLVPGWYLCHFLLLRIATTIAVTATPAAKHKISLSGIIGANLLHIHCPASLNQFKRFNAFIEMVPEVIRITPTKMMTNVIISRFTFFDIMSYLQLYLMYLLLYLIM